MMQRILTYLAPALLTLALVGCPKPGPVGTRRPVAPRIQRLTMEPMMIVASRSGAGYKSEAFSAEELFRAGYTAQKKGDCKAAAATYAKLLRYFARSPYGPPTNFNRGLCLVRLRRFGEAARHFEAAAKGVTRADEIILAYGAAGVNYAEAKAWADSRRCFQTLLARKDLETHQRIQAYARLGMAWFKSDNNSRARAALDAALALYRKTRTTVRLPSHFYVAMAAYYKAAIYHKLATDTPIRLPVAQMQQDVETWATWMYKAQRAYWDAVAFKDHFWAMAATYQVGALYWEFRKALVGAPEPRFTSVRYFDKALGRYATITASEQRAEYLNKLRAKTRVLLKHAMTVWNKAVSTAERIGAKNQWVTRMRKSLASVKARYAKEPTEVVTPTGPSVRPRPGRSPLVPKTLDPRKYRPAAIDL